MKSKAITKLIFLLFTSILALSGCCKEEKVVILDEGNKYKNISSTTQQGANIFEKSLNAKIKLNKHEQDVLNKLKKKGHLYIATRDKITVYEPQKNGTIKGFHYNLIKYIASEMGVKLKIKKVSFSDYFNKNGKLPKNVKTDNSVVYTPDLIKNVDLYVDVITILPWRDELLDFIQITPVKQIVVTRKNGKIDNNEGLKGKKIAMQMASSYATRAQKIEKDLGIKFNFLEVNETGDMPVAVAEGKADVTFQDSDMALLTVSKHKNLTLCYPVTDTQYLGWAVRKGNGALKGLIEKYIKYAKDKGVLDKLFKQRYGMTLIEYLKLIKA